jgi:hypothetical protein
MRALTRRATIVAAGTAIGILGFTGLAFAGGSECPPPPPPSQSKCNAGNGNGSEEASDSCIGGDPGKSFEAGNRGGDEGGTPVENPGGNNVG